MDDSQATYPLPEDPPLAEVAAALQGSGHWGWVVDDRWRVMFVTDELRLTFGGNVELADWPIGAHFFGPEFLAATQQWRFGTTTGALFRSNFAAVGGWVLADTPGGREELRELVDPSLRDMVDGLAPTDQAGLWFAGQGMALQDAVAVPIIGFRIRDRDGRLAGTAVITKPAAGMATLGSITSMGDPRHYRRMLQVAKAGRRPAAILFADLEASSPLARRLSTASYFALGRRLVRASDRCIIDAGGLPGRHVGDGVVAFFLAETLGSESTAARACISRGPRAPRRGSRRGGPQRPGAGGRHAAVRPALGFDALRRQHHDRWALRGHRARRRGQRGCAYRGVRHRWARAGVEEPVERLDPDDAAALDLDPDHVTYTSLADLDSATEKARRDAPAIAVCDV